LQLASFPDDVLLPILNQASADGEPPIILLLTLPRKQSFERVGQSVAKLVTADIGQLVGNGHRNLDLFVGTNWLGVPGDRLKLI